MFSSRTSINSAVDPFVPVEKTRMDPWSRPVWIRSPRHQRCDFGLHAKFKVLLYHRASASVKQQRGDTESPECPPSSSSGLDTRSGCCFHRRSAAEDKVQPKTTRAVMEKGCIAPC